MNRSTKWLTVLAVIISALTVLPACATTWQAAADMHAAYTAGVYTYNDWSYGWTLSTSTSLNSGYTFGLMTARDTSYWSHERMNGIPGSSVYGAVYYNPSSTDSPNSMVLAYGLGLLSPSQTENLYKTALRFTAPVTGSYAVTSSFALGWSTQPGASVDVHVMKFVNSTSVQELAAASLLGATSALSLAYNNTVVLNAGESLDFVVGNSGNGQGYDMTRTDVTIVSAAGGTVSGTVSGPSGAVSGATVSVVGGSGSTTTASDGTYTLPLFSGTYTLKASKAGLKSAQISDVTVTDGATLTRNFTLTAPNWQQVGATTPGALISSPDSTTWTTFSSTGDMPTSLAIAGGVLPNLKVTYRAYSTGISGYGNQSAGRHGLGLFLGASPSISDGLFGGFDIWYSGNGYYGAIAGPTGSPADPTGGTCLLTLDQWTALGYPLMDFDVTMDVIEGVVTTTLVPRSAGVPGHVKSYTLTPSDISNWAGQMKYAVYKSDYSYSKTVASDIVFYKDADQVLPHGTIQGDVTLNGSTVGAGATVATTDGAFSTVADSAGHYSINLAPGTYSLRASKNAFAPQDQGPISLADGQTVTQNFNLTGPNWVQAGPTIATTYATPAEQLTAPGFSEVGQMPITLEAAGGVLPNLKCTYTLQINSFDPPTWGQQLNGNSGLALFVDATPSASSGLFTGVRHPGNEVGAVTSAGAMASSFAEVATPSSTFTPASTYNVTVEEVNGTVWTTLQNVNTGTYTVSSTDITNWSGKLGFAAFKSGPAVNWGLSRTFVSNITFYRDANQPPTNAGFVTGTVTAANLPGNPAVAGAEVKIMGDGFSTTTNSTGFYELTVRPGDLTVRTSASGYATQEPTVPVAAGATVTHNVALSHSGTWDLFSDFNTSYNPNGQWAYGYTQDQTTPLVPYADYAAYDGGLAYMNAWAKTADGVRNPWYGWLTKNSTGAPITWNCPVGDPLEYKPYGYIEDNEMSFGGGGLWWNNGMGYSAWPRIRWTAPDQRMVKVYFKIAGQSPTSRTAYLTVAKNNQPAALKQIQGFVGRAVNGYTDSVGPAPTATFETQLLVSTGDTIDFVQGRSAPEFGITGAWDGFFGYPWSSMAIWVTVSPGDALICSSWNDLKAKNVGDTVYMNSPVQLASATSGAGSFDKKFGDPTTTEHVFFIQNDDRTQSIKCVSDGTLSPFGADYKIVFTGKVEVDPLNAAKKIIRIMSINSATLGADAKPLGKGSKALTNTGTLVKVWGKITSMTVNPNAWSDLWDSDPTSGVNMVPKYDYEYITINDGGSDVKVLMHVQTNLMTNVDGTIGGLAVGDYVAVTGIAGTINGTDVVVAPRNVGDILEYVP